MKMQGERYHTKLERETVQENGERYKDMVFLYFDSHLKRLNLSLSPVLFRTEIDGSGTQQSKHVRDPRLDSQSCLEEQILSFVFSCKLDPINYKHKEILQMSE